MFDIAVNNITMYGQLLESFLTGAGDATMSDEDKRSLRAIWHNNQAFQLMFCHNMNIAQGLYHVKRKSGADLTAGLNERTIKLSFIVNGCVFLRNKVIQNGKEYPGFYAQAGRPYGIYNMNMDPLKGFATDLNGANGQDIDLFVPGDEAPATQIAQGGIKTRNPSGFIVWDNDMRIPPILYIIYYSLKEAEVLRSLDSQIPWLGVPIVFTSTPELVDSINKAMTKIFNHEAYTIESNSVSGIGQATNLINTNVNGQTLKDSTALFQWYDAQLMQFFGINSNSQFDKKGENLINAELTANNEITEMNRNNPIECKNRGFEAGSKMPGMEECDLVIEPIDYKPQVPQQTGGQEGEENADDNADGSQHDI